MNYITQLRVFTALSLLALASCAKTMPPTTQAPHLSKPAVSLSQAQWAGLERAVKEAMTQRETQWNGIYQDYLRRP